jgi:tetratricopeptide (TPR) repeat protein
MPIFNSEKRKNGRSSLRAMFGRVGLLIVVAALLGALSAQFVFAPRDAAKYRVVLEIEPDAPLLLATFQQALAAGLRERGVAVIEIANVKDYPQAHEITLQHNALLTVWSENFQLLETLQGIAPAKANLVADFMTPSAQFINLSLYEEIDRWVLLILGMAAYQQEDYMATIQYLKPFESSLGLQATADLYLAGAYYHLHQYQQTFEILNRHDVDNVYLPYNRALTAFKIGHSALAYRTLSAFLDRWGNSVPAAFCLRAQVAEVLQLYHVALDDYQALALTDGECSTSVANSERQLEQQRNALPSPAADNLYEVFQYALAQKDYAAALEPVQTHLAQNPTDSYWLNHLGYVQLALHDYEAAYNTFNQVVELDPNDAYALAMRGKATILRFPAAIEAGEQDFQRALAVAPDYYGTYLTWGLAYEAWSAPQQAAPLYLQWLQRPDTDWQPRRTLPTNTRELTMREGRVYEFALELTERQTLDIIAAADNPYTLDPLLVLLDANGNAI